MLPGEEYLKYIAFLARAVWLKPDEVVKALELQGNEVLVDLGAGFFVFGKK